MRRRRFRFFQSLLEKTPRPVRILDVGGTQDYWSAVGLDRLEGVHVTLVNLHAQTTTLANLSSIVGNACRLDLPDGSFDIVVSNSVIEHVGLRDEQRRMADEIRRVGKRYFVQTPNFWFPIEPHFMFPLFQFFPIAVRAWLLMRMPLAYAGRIGTREDARRVAEGVRLLSRSEFCSLFPGAALYRERLLGLTKSFIVYGGWDAP
jgi:hypothetical protein